MTVRVWTLIVEGVDEPSVVGWRAVLDPAEQARADRFVFARHRVQYIAAHALVRTVLSTIISDAHPASWQFVGAENTKPVAWLNDRPTAVSFNLSHTNGMVGVAVVPGEGRALGFDLEQLDRKFTLEVADHYFRPEEVAWLRSLPESARPEGFLRLWTLKESFIKATGEGLSRDLASFGFTPSPPRIHFTPNSTERAEDWHFEQRIIAGNYVAAVGLCRTEGTPPPAIWTEAAQGPGDGQILFRTAS
jgi:4'-phosphopantetheinyl transferase